MYVIASGIDVTAQRRAQVCFRGQLEAVPDAVVVVNQKGKIVLVDAQVEKLFGYHRQELLGEEIEQLVPQRLRGNHPAQRRHFAAEPSVRPVGAGLELRALHKDGHEFPVEISLSPLETEEGVLVSSAIRDIRTTYDTAERAVQYVIDPQGSQFTVRYIQGNRRGCSPGRGHSRAARPG